jgi:arylsulfatase A
VARTDPRPNIVLINCDDLGYGDLGCYGSTVHATPSIDRMASEGLLFEDFTMASPVCSPSRAAMLTGCYPPRIGFGSLDGMPVLFPGQGVGLASTETTVADLLRGAGYRTLMVGKWHCGDQPGFLPTDHGFERFFGLPYSNDMGRQTGTPTTDDGDQLGYPPLPLLVDDRVVEQQPDQTSLTTRYVDEVVGFLREHRDEPCFVYLAHLYVHIPIYAEDRFTEASSNGRYGAGVAAIDDATGAVLDALDDLGLADDTIVIFTSDNGALDRSQPHLPPSDPDAGVGSNRPLRGAKGTSWEGGSRVPAIVRWPGRIAGGRRTTEHASSLDLLPTLAGIAGAAVPTDRAIDGVDIGDLWFDENATSPRVTSAYYVMNDLAAVRDGRWKLHVARHGEPVRELYDLATDRGETSDVAGDHPDVVALLEAAADRYRAELGDARLGLVGTGVRPVGRVDDPRPLTAYDPTHPYVVAEYDLPDRG